MSIMKRNKRWNYSRRFVAVFMILAMCLGCMHIVARAENTSGICGENLTYTIENMSTLKIEGTGDMYDYENTAPWYENYHSQITKVVIGEGVTSIGENAFYNCQYLTKIIGGESITSIGQSAFYNCYKLTDYNIPANVTYIGSHAFWECKSLTEVVIPSGVVSILMCTFNGSGLETVVLPKSIQFIGDSAFICGHLTDVYYEGSEEDWGNIHINKYNISLLSYATIHYNSAGPDEGDTDSEEPSMPDSEVTPTMAITVPSTISSDSAVITCTVTLAETNREYLTEFMENLTYSFDGEAYMTMDSIATEAAFPAMNVTKSYEIASDGRSASCRLSMSRISFQATYCGSGTVTFASADGKFEASADFSVSLKMFDEYVYRANKMSTSSYVPAATLKKYVEIGTPCELLTEALSESGFNTLSFTWEALTAAVDTVNDVTTLAELMTDEKEMYSAILLSIFEAAAEYDGYKTEESILKTGASIGKTITATMKLNYNIDVSDANDWAGMTNEQIEQVKKLAKEQFKQNYPNIEIVDDIFEGISISATVFDSATSFLEYYSSAYALCYMSDSMQTVLKEMYETCPESSSYASLREAIADCIEIVDTAMEEMQTEMFQGAFAIAGTAAAEYLAGEVWSCIKKSVDYLYPGLSIILTTYKATKLLTNTWFDTDDTIEQYYRMNAMLKVEDLLLDTVNSLEETYLETGDSADAEAYLSGIDVLFSAWDYDCQYAYKFVDILDETVINRLTELITGTADSDMENAKDSITGIQTNYALLHVAVLTNWVYYLEEDYPGYGLADDYENLFEETLERYVTKSYTAACPVDVYVYDSAGTLVASVVDNFVYCQGNLTVVLRDDSKTIYFHDSEEYTIQYIGNDSGAMDVTLTEYDANGVSQRDVYFYDVELEDGTNYEVAEDTGANGDVEYGLSSQNDVIIRPDIDTAAVNQTYTATAVSAYFLNEGSAEGTVEAPEGRRLTVKAFLPDGYEFVEWTSDAGTDIFEDAYSNETIVTMPQTDIAITAILERTAVTVTRLAVDDGNIEYYMIAALVGSRDAEQIVFSQAGEFEESQEVELYGLDIIEGNKALLLQTDSTGSLTLVDQAMIENDTVTFSVSTGADGVVVYGYNGDVTGDGEVNASDTLAILRGVSGRASLDEVEKGFADVNLDGQVNSNDLLAVVKYVSGRTSTLN